MLPISTRVATLSSLFIAAFLALTSCGDSSSVSLVHDFTEDQLKGTDLEAMTISLTFDDGPSSRTSELVDYLTREDVYSTFFVVGEKAVHNRSVLQKMRAQGHLVGNHSYSHPQLPRSSDARAISEVKDTDAIIAPYVSGNNFVFRAPYADWSGHLARILNAVGLTKYVGSIVWEVGTRVRGDYGADWECWSLGLSVADCGQRYLNEIEDKQKGIVLLHDLHSKTVDMVKWMVPRLKEKGFRFVRVDEVPNIANSLRALGANPGEGLPPR